jgi:aryl-alcohol dehydrogenase-like predicted oxidoreductase
VRYSQLSNTDIEVSQIAFGAWGIIGGFNWGEQAVTDSLAALRTAFECGITLFDTAEGYGDGASERLIAKALGDVRDQIVIASKVLGEHLEPTALKAACDRSLEALSSDYIDLYQVHWPNAEVPLADTFGALDELVAAGKIRAYGVSNFGKSDLSACLAAAPAVCSNQVAYNLLFRAIEYDILPDCREAGVSVLCYSTLMQGLLTGKFTDPDGVPADRARTRHFASSRPHSRHSEAGAEAETFAAIARLQSIADDLGQPMADVSLAWLLAQPGVTAAIVGGRNAEQARRNATAADLELSDDVVAALSDATAELKACLGSNADMWQSDSRIH